MIRHRAKLVHRKSTQTEETEAPTAMDIVHIHTHIYNKQTSFQKNHIHQTNWSQPIHIL